MHLGGEGEHDQTNWTTGARVGFHGWRVGGTYSLILNDAGEPDENVDGHMVQFSAGYGFDLGTAGELGVDVGWWQREDVEGESDDRVGVGVTWHVDL